MNFTDLHTEQLLLGSLLLNNAAIMEIKLSPHDFSTLPHVKLFERMQRTFSENQIIDSADFHDIQDTFPDDLDAVSYARLLMESVIVAGTENIKGQAATLLELSRKRFISHQIKRAQVQLATEPCNKIIAELHASLADGLDTRSLRTSEEIHAEIVKALELPKECHPTGIEPLDMAMNGGLYQGFTYGFAGAEKSGKTTLAHTVSYNLGNSGCKHLYIALEMGPRQIEERNLARTAGINSLEFIRPSQESKNRIETSRPTKNVIYSDAPGATVDEILHMVGVASMKHGIRGFVVDYWQLVEGKDFRDTDERHLRFVAQALANYARKKNLWCIVLAQMNKEGDLFGGGGLRKACDQLYFIETPERHPDFRWLRMGASRYTPKVDVGSEDNPSLVLNKRVGPYFKDARMTHE